ncbi:hypothetical protein K461DRAFT_314372 [Myriangium duriaei CBS 260.36]|uniref:Uncharacterized protein n=1 Tax=Myriangium duriaei CBS 260.36 TaxID=1168546 RepID=A0A9P4MEM4_9PEZI|nr:hypothetical protein K461DRAFT_314372 [Myriangium duriaei CBS 260.36]
MRSESFRFGALPLLYSFSLTTALSKDYQLGSCSKNSQSISNANASATFQIPGFSIGPNSSIATSSDASKAWSVTQIVTRLANAEKDTTTAGTFLVLPPDQGTPNTHSPNVVTCASYAGFAALGISGLSNIAHTENGSCSSIMLGRCKSDLLDFLHQRAAVFVAGGLPSSPTVCDDFWNIAQRKDFPDSCRRSRNGTSNYVDNIAQGPFGTSWAPYYGNNSCPAPMLQQVYDLDMGDVDTSENEAKANLVAPNDDGNFTAYDNALRSFNSWLIVRFANSPADNTLKPVVDVSILCPIASNVKNGSRLPLPPGVGVYTVPYSSAASSWKVNVFLTVLTTSLTMTALL